MESASIGIVQGATPDIFVTTTDLYGPINSGDETNHRTEFEIPYVFFSCPADFFCTALPEKPNGTPELQALHETGIAILRFFENRSLQQIQ